MLMVINGILMIMMSLVGGQSSGEPDPHGLRKLVQNQELRALLLSGNVHDYNASLEGALAARMAQQLKANGSRANATSVSGILRDGSREELQGLLGALKASIMLASFVTELQALGPAKALGEAVSWVESGLIRQSGMKQDNFPSFYQIISRPNRARIDGMDQRALSQDLSHANSRMDSSYSRLFAEVNGLLN